MQITITQCLESLRRAFSKLTHAGILASMDSRLKKCVILSNQICLVFCASMAILTVFYYMYDFKIIALIGAMILALMGSSIYLSYRGWYNASRFTIIFTANLGLFVMSWIFGRDAGLFYGFFVLVGSPLVFFQLHETRYIITLTLLPVIGFFIIVLLPAHFFYSAGASLAFDFINKEIMSVFILFVNFITIYYFYAANESSEKSLEVANTELDRKFEELKVAQAMISENARYAGMAEIATGILHNIGNTLNSVIVGAETIAGTLDTNSKDIDKFNQANTLLQENLGNISEYLSVDPKGSLLPEYYVCLSKAMGADTQLMKNEIMNVRERIQLIKEFIATQQIYAKGVEFKEEVFVTDAIEAALVVQISDLGNHHIEVVKNIASHLVILAQKAKLIYVLVNLIKNAKEAMITTPDRKHILAIEVGQDPDQVFIKIADNGTGVARENLHRIFNYGFTTKPNGHGFGLHSSANVISEMGGKLSVTSEGVGTGATFTISFPNSLLV